MGFIQIIEYKTSRIDELNAMLDDWLEQTKGKRLATRGTQTRDHDAENTYVQIVVFPSYEDAMANSKMPETGEFRGQAGGVVRRTAVLPQSRCHPRGADVADVRIRL